MKTIVVSAVNLNSGGPLTILRDCLQYLSEFAEKENIRIVALVYRKELAFYPNIEYIEMQWPKKAWVMRLWCEYVTMRKISQRLFPVTLWLSLHDTTPSVSAERRAVYCHNSFPFYRWKMREWLFSPKVVMFSLFSKYAYRIHIHQNTNVIVQQQWLRREFVKLFSLPEDKIIVAPPQHTAVGQRNSPTDVSDEYSFLYATSSNSHKNVECLCEAACRLHKRLPELKFKVYITVKGDENRYAKWLYKHWGQDASCLQFVGFLKREKLYEYYRLCDCLVFPSKVETWGLPVTEFAVWRKPMLLADLPYAHETAEGCDNVSFFNPERPDELAMKMEKLLRGDSSFLINIVKHEKKEPEVESWDELFKVLLA